MAGHSKWNNIKHKKGKEDARRAKEFTKLGRYIMVAAREGGADPEYNPALKAAIEKARAANMPNENIERAIKKGSGEIDGQNFESIVYEGYGPGGIAVFVSCLTDNRNRTASDIRHAFDKFGGNLGQTGCVSFMFDRKGLLVVEANENIDEEELMLQAIELGAEDFSSEDGVYEIITSPEDFNDIRDALSNSGYEFSVAELAFLPQNTTELKDEEDIKNMIKLIETLEDNDDVQNVYHNWEIPDDLEL
ncbi:YebC/PmpR family DNA-binding transcriptional regulator [Tepidimicrobium xylanilyticum]|uniref:Probable transcriptional regulatory protein SAMN05660923_00537 n=1 Tax=Tepidimicrobium xylanilyticum TaxID=1123352 RepID=A0A1H2STB7_9FIRM|nr:YebC/PmpR family DNA-binding transcriptional regulator [Tepidimicrobium xylanilyticum]GMG96124.1 putative transcriptional regulatory protein [Tepidimicrobium xylanilyticum]SDW34828.1 DNA-binding regulatory protein, YebC/PmpR family [Tepidimicrobium xylanilyticum]